jgi:hypothetical protein
MQNQQNIKDCYSCHAHTQSITTVTFYSTNHNITYHIFRHGNDSSVEELSSPTYHGMLQTTEYWYIWGIVGGAGTVHSVYKQADLNPGITHSIQIDTGAHPAFYPMGNGVWPGHEADHSPPSSAEVMSRGAIPPFPHILLE